MVNKGKKRVSLEDFEEGQVNDFSTYHLQTFDSEVDIDYNVSDYDSLYDVDENIDDLSDLDEELLQARQSNFEKQVKEKADRAYSIQKGVNLKLKPNKKEREVLTKNGEHLANCEVRFNGDIEFKIGDPPYKYIINVKRKKNCFTSSFGTTIKSASGGHLSVFVAPSVQLTTGTSASGVRYANTLACGKRPANASSGGKRPINTLEGFERPTNATLTRRRPSNATTT
ncbi:hypothetical protein FXO38_04690 [Capsicum annuum]|nr:hypothetical protein FXO38_04690 [Capsicum annuum]KAF3678371.1 hypothetical protein FXO37_04410 [Capsicum annuum]